MYWPRGRVLEARRRSTACCGCAGSRQNTMRGATAGCSGWGYETCCPFSSVARPTSGAIRRDAGQRGRSTSSSSSPMTWARVPPRLPGGRHPATADYNGAQYEGVGILQTNTAGPAPWRPRGLPLIPRAVARRWRSVPVCEPTHPRRQRARRGVEYGEAANDASCAPAGGDRLGRNGAEPASVGTLRHR